MLSRYTISCLFVLRCRSLPDPPPMTVRPIGEAQAALNLAHFAGSVGSVIDTSGLINTLLVSTFLFPLCYDSFAEHLRINTNNHADISS